MTKILLQVVEKLPKNVNLILHSSQGIQLKGLSRYNIDISPLNKSLTLGGRSDYIIPPIPPIPPIAAGSNFSSLGKSVIIHSVVIIKPAIEAAN